MTASAPAIFAATPLCPVEELKSAFEELTTAQPKAWNFVENGADGDNSPSMFFHHCPVPRPERLSFLSESRFHALLQYDPKYSIEKLARLSELSITSRIDGISFSVLVFDNSRFVPIYGGSAPSVSLSTRKGKRLELSSPGSREEQQAFVKTFLRASTTSPEINFQNDSGGYKFDATSKTAGWKVATERGSVVHLDCEDDATILDVFRAGVEKTFGEPRELSLVTSIVESDLVERRGELNAICTDWCTEILDMKYSSDIWARPKKISANDPYRFPLLRLESKKLNFQLDLVHGAKGSFLELMTNSGEKELRKLIKTLGLPCDIWDKEPHLRWDGKGGGRD